MGDEIEHIKPKDLYPGRTFVWENYLLACGQCNRGKSSRFSVIVCGGLVDITRRRNAPVLRPPEDPPALIVPREEDPLAFLDLEMMDTFMFLPREDLQGIHEERAQCTIEGAEAQPRRIAGGTPRSLPFVSSPTLRVSRPSRQWRQRDGAWNTEGRDNDEHAPDGLARDGRQHDIIDELRVLFVDVPEALTW